MPDLKCEYYSSLDSVTAEEWDRLLPDHPDSLEMVRLAESSGIKGFRFRSIVVRKNNIPLLYVPIFETQYRIADFVEGPFQKWIRSAEKIFPSVFMPRILGIGFVEGEWATIGVDPDIDDALFEECWDSVNDKLKHLAPQYDLTAFVNFTQATGKALPLKLIKRYTGIMSLPYAFVPLGYETLDDYIQKLTSANMRSSLRRKLKKAEGIKIVRTRDAKAWMDTIYSFYFDTVKDSDVIFGTHNREYFEKVCEQVPSAEYILYFEGEKLLAFRLVVQKPGLLIDKYFGMDRAEGRQRNLYFVSWLENIRYCIENNIPFYYAGQAEEETKGRLGAHFFSSANLFRYRNPLLHHLISFLAKRISYKPKVSVSLPPLGFEGRKSPPQKSFQRAPSLLTDYKKLFQSQ